MTFTYKLLPGECWWGGSVVNSEKMPFDEHTNFSWDLRTNGVHNQTMPLLLSNCGRYIWCEDPFAFSFQNGVITAEADTEVTLTAAGNTLRDAYHAAMAAHFPFDGRKLPDVFFETAQYNGWMQFMYEPTQEGTLEYARGIIQNGFTPGILMIDEGWQKEYGTWEFDHIKFPDPKAMIEELHAMGFKVMLWVVPYVTASGYNYVLYHSFHPDSKSLFLRNEDGDVSLIAWWNGTSAILDFTKECDRRFMDTQLQTLIDTYGVDGFKFDGGDVSSYRSARIVNGTPSSAATAEERNAAWLNLGRKYEFHEYKDSYRQGGLNMIQRLADKEHSWTTNGINTIVSSSLIQGLMGTPFICPDMIGGGSWSTFRYDLHATADQELFVRMAQCSALLPMMQFSLAPWQYLDADHLALCLDMAKLHKKYAPYILELVHDAETSGEPIVQHLAYAFPDGGYERCNDCYMLGTRILVAPVIHKGETKRTLVLPDGNWKYVDGTVYTGGKVTVDAPLHVLPYFERV